MYAPVTYVRHDTPLKDVLKHMVQNKAKFAVVKKGKREVGMIGEYRLKETLNRQSLEYSEETKDYSYFD